MLKKNSINHEILRFFLIFSIVIISILWIFQIIFFNSFYKSQKINDIKVVANKIKQEQNNKNLYETINNLAFDRSVCIEVIDKDYNLLYSSTYFGKGCVSNSEKTSRFKFDFITSKNNEYTYEVQNPDFNNDTIIQALKLNKGQFVFINTSLEPVDSIVFLIRKQLIILTIIILILSYILAYFISNHISKPIVNINNEAKKLSTNKPAHFENSNILEINELATTLNYAQEELNKTEELRRDLMANVSHDLKTPITMIKAYAEMAKDLHLNKTEKQIEDMDIIISETDRLTTLINDILELSKMESVNEELNIEEFDLINLIKEILTKYKVLQEKELYTFNFIHKDKKLLVNADKKRLEQVIYNLINNAINYTGEDNKVTIKVTNNESIKVEIIDTGKGIKQEDIPYIWDKYYKNKKKHKRNLIGTGLGLSIVKNILESHNFKYGVNSKENVGTTFYFIIKNS